MAPRITGLVQIATPGPGRKFVRPIANRIAWELESQGVGRIEEARGTVRFRRESGVRSNRGLFVSFDPGEFVVDPEAKGVTIRYVLGLGPLYFVLALAALGFAYSVYVSHDLRTILIAAIGVIAVLGGGFLFNLWRLRVWLKAAAATAIAKAGESKD